MVKILQNVLRSIYDTLKYTLMRFLLKLIKLNIILNTLPLKL